jgi:hypothetical protein
VKSDDATPHDLIAAFEQEAEVRELQIIETSMRDNAVILTAEQKSTFQAYYRDIVLKAVSDKLSADDKLLSEKSFDMQDENIDDRYIPPAATFLPFMVDMSTRDHLRVEARIDDVVIEKPTMTPFEARQTKSSYLKTLCIHISIQVKMYTHEGREHVFDLTPGATHWIPLAKMPCVVRSQHCVLHSMTNNELRAARHDPRDKGGYTIENGNMMFLHYGFRQTRALSILKLSNLVTEGRHIASSQLQELGCSYFGCTVELVVPSKQAQRQSHAREGESKEKAYSEISCPIVPPKNNPQSLFEKVLQQMMSTVLNSSEAFLYWTGHGTPTELVSRSLAMDRQQAALPEHSGLSANWDPELAYQHKRRWMEAMSSRSPTTERHNHSSTALNNQPSFEDTERHTTVPTRGNKAHATSPPVVCADNYPQSKYTYERYHLCISVNFNQVRNSIPCIVLLAALSNEVLNERHIIDFARIANNGVDEHVESIWKHSFATLGSSVNRGPKHAIKRVGELISANNTTKMYDNGICFLRTMLGPTNSYVTKQLLIVTLLELIGATLRVHLGLDQQDDVTDFSRRSILTPLCHRQKTNRILRHAVNGLLDSLVNNFGSNHTGWQMFSASIVACDLSQLFNFRDTSEVPWRKIYSNEHQMPFEQSADTAKHNHFKSSAQSHSMRRGILSALSILNKQTQPLLKRAPQPTLNPFHCMNETMTLSFGHSTHTPAKRCRINGNLFPFVSIKSTGQGNRCGDYAIASMGTAVSRQLTNDQENALTSMLIMSIRSIKHIGDTAFCGRLTEGKNVSSASRHEAAVALATLVQTRNTMKDSFDQKVVGDCIDAVLAYIQSEESVEQCSLWDWMQQFSCFQGIERCALVPTSPLTPGPKRSFSDFNLAMSFISQREIMLPSKVTAIDVGDFTSLREMLSTWNANVPISIENDSSAILNQVDACALDSEAKVVKTEERKESVESTLLAQLNLRRTLIRERRSSSPFRHPKVMGLSSIGRGVATAVPSDQFWDTVLTRQHMVQSFMDKHAQPTLLDPEGIVRVYYNHQVIGWIYRKEVEATTYMWDNFLRRPESDPRLRQVDVYFDVEHNKLFVDSTEGRLLKAVFELDPDSKRPLMTDSMKWLCNPDSGSVSEKLGAELQNSNARRILHDGSLLWVSANAIQFSEVRMKLSASMCSKSRDHSFSRTHPYVRRVFFMPSMLSTALHESTHFDAQSPFHRQTVNNKIVSQSLNLPFQYSECSAYTMVQPSLSLSRPWSKLNLDHLQQESVHTVSIQTLGSNVEDAVAVTYEGQMKLQTTQTQVTLTPSFLLTHQAALKEAGCLQRKNTAADPEKLAYHALDTNTEKPFRNPRTGVLALFPPPEVIGVPTRFRSKLSTTCQTHLESTRRLDPVTRLIPLNSKVVKGEPLVTLTRIFSSDPSDVDLSVRSIYLVTQELEKHRTGPVCSSDNVFDSAPAVDRKFTRDAEESAAGTMHTYMMNQSKVVDRTNRSFSSQSNVSSGSGRTMAQKEREALHRSIDIVVQKTKERRNELDARSISRFDDMIARLENERKMQLLEIRAMNQLLYMDYAPTIWELKYQTETNCVDIERVITSDGSDALYDTVHRLYSDKRLQYIETMTMREEIVRAPCSGTVTDIRFIPQDTGLFQISFTIQSDTVTGDGSKIQTRGNGSKGVIMLQADAPRNTVMKSNVSILVDAISTIPGRITMYLVVECLVSLAVARYRDCVLQTTKHGPESYPASHRREDDDLNLPTFIWSASNLECLSYLAESAGKFPLEFGCAPCGHLVQACSSFHDQSNLRPPVDTVSIEPSPSTHLPDSPTYVPESPTYVPESPTYLPESPTYLPESPTYLPESPTYLPESPTYQPESPTYLPESPTYRSELTEVTEEMESLHLPPPVKRKRDEISTSNTIEITPQSRLENTEEGAITRSCRFPVICFECGRRVDRRLFLLLKSLGAQKMMQLETCCLATYSTFEILEPLT